MILGTGTTTGTFQPLNPSIDTSQANQWSATANCPSGFYWDCTNQSCDASSSAPLLNVFNSQTNSCTVLPLTWWSIIMPTNEGCPKAGSVTMSDFPTNEYTCCLAGMEPVGDSSKTVILSNSGQFYTASLNDVCNGGVAQVMGVGYCVSNTNYQCPTCAYKNNYYECSNCTYSVSALGDGAHPWTCPSCVINNKTYEPFSYYDVPNEQQLCVSSGTSVQQSASIVYST